MISKDDLLEIIDDQTTTDAEKTRKLNKLGSVDIEITIKDWELHNFSPRDEWFYISYNLMGQFDKLHMNFIPRGHSEAAINHLVSKIEKHKGKALRIRGVSESGGHAISATFSVEITDIETLNK